MTLGEDVAAALPEMQAQAESLMVDACTITHAGTSTWDENTGTYSDGSATTVYAGKCRLQSRDVQPNTTEAGQTEWSLLAYVLQVPMSVTGVRVGDAVSVTSTLDADLASRPFTVVGVIHKTHMSARRIVLEEVS